MVFDLKGTLLETYYIDNNREKSIVIEGKEFKAGMYLYSLVIDGVEIDSKKMILQR
jgi:hypothetical protein